MLSVFICQLFLLNVNAYVGNGFLWNKTEIYVDLNSNFDDYIKEFEVKFYYKGDLTNEEVKVSLDSFYYGNLTISTNIVETKAVKMIATVPGYSSYDRRDILVHVVDIQRGQMTCQLNSLAHFRSFSLIIYVDEWFYLISLPVSS